MPCSNDKVKEGLNWQIATQSLFDCLENFKFNNASNTAAENEISRYLSGSLLELGYPSKLKILVPAYNGLILIFQGKSATNSVSTTCNGHASSFITVFSAWRLYEFTQGVHKMCPHGSGCSGSSLRHEKHVEWLTN